MSGKKDDTSVKVVVRLRPLNAKEKRGQTLPVVTASTQRNEVTVVKGISTKATRHSYHFDSVLTEFTSQSEVFKASLAPMIKDVLKGFDATCFAYGQTGTGKTFTMEGNIDVEEQSGIIPRSCMAIFKDINKPGKYVGSSVKISYLEIYNEELSDLLSPNSDGSHLKICENAHGKVSCLGLSEQKVESASEVLKILKMAQEHRSVAETKMNKASSRSHCLFSLKVETKEEVNGGLVVRKGKLHLVDLAGSECAKNTGVNSGNRFRESQNINKSLLTLGRVITALKSQQARIPYRDSKLTRLLQDALGGSNKTCIIATLSPSHLSVDESLSTLKYAEKAQGIKNKRSDASIMMQAGGGKEDNAACDVKTFNEMEQRMLYMQTQCEEAQAALGRKYEEVLALTSRAEDAESNLDTALRKLSNTEHHLGVARSGNEKLLQLVQSDKVAAAEQRTLLQARCVTEPTLLDEAGALLTALDEAAAEAETRFTAAEARFKEQERVRQAAVAMQGEAEGAMALLRTAAAEFGAGHATALDALNTLVTETAADAGKGFCKADEASQAIVQKLSAAAATASQQLTEGSEEAAGAARAALEAHTASMTATMQGSSATTSSLQQDLGAVVQRFQGGEAALNEWMQATSAKLAAAADAMQEKMASHAAALASALQDEQQALVQGGEHLSQQSTKLTALAASLQQHAQTQHGLSAAIEQHQEAATARLSAQKQLLEQQQTHIGRGIAEQQGAGAAVRAAHTATLHSLLATLRADSVALQLALEAQAEQLQGGKAEFEASSGPAMVEQLQLLEAAGKQLAKQGTKQLGELEEQKRMLHKVLNNDEMLGGTASAKKGMQDSLNASLEASQAGASAQGELLEAQRVSMQQCVTETLQGQAASALQTHLASVAVFKETLRAASTGQKALLEGQQKSLTDTMTFHNEENTKARANQQQALQAMQQQVDTRNQAQRNLLAKHKAVAAAAAATQQEGRAALVQTVMAAMQEALESKVAALAEAFSSSMADLVGQASEMEAQVGGLEQEVQASVVGMVQGADQWLQQGQATFVKLQGIQEQNQAMDEHADQAMVAANELADNLAVEASAWGAVDKQVEEVAQAAIATNASTVQAIAAASAAAETAASGMQEQVLAWEKLNKAAAKQTKQAATKNGQATKTQETLQKQLNKQTAKQTAAVEAWGASNQVVMGMLQQGIDQNVALKAQEAQLANAQQVVVATAQQESEEHIAVDSNILAAMTDSHTATMNLLEHTETSASETTEAFGIKQQQMSLVLEHNQLANDAVATMSSDNSAMAQANQEQQQFIATTQTSASSEVSAIGSTMASNFANTTESLQCMLASRKPVSEEITQAANTVGESMMSAHTTMSESVTEALTALSASSESMQQTLGKLSASNSKATTAATVAATKAQKAMSKSITSSVESLAAWKQGHEQQVEALTGMATSHATASEEHTSSVATAVTSFCKEGAKLETSIVPVDALSTPFFSRHLTTTAKDEELLEFAKQEIESSTEAAMTLLREQLGQPAPPTTVVAVGEIDIEISPSSTTTTAAGDVVKDKENGSPPATRKSTSPKRKMPQNNTATKSRSALQAIENTSEPEVSVAKRQKVKKTSRLRAPSSRLRAPK